MAKSFFGGAYVGLGSICCAGVMVGCSLDFATSGIEEEIEKAGERLGDIEVCDGMTIEELMDAQTISDECKDEVQSFLPQPEDNFEDRVMILGSDEGDDGSLSIFLHGADDGGEALNADAWSDVEVSVLVDGETVVLAEGDFELVAAVDLDGDLMSIAFVNDYSGSMSDGDLEVTAEIETDIINVLPAVFEGEVTQFSTDVAQRLAFTEDRSDLLSAVTYDPDFLRDLTALYDGMGTGLDSLVARDRPIRLLVVATDGQENESTSYTKAELIETIEDHRVCVLMLGSLFSEPSELRDFSSSCGFYFYTRGYSELKSAVSEYVESLGSMTELRIPSGMRGDGAIQVTLGDWSGQVDSRD